MSRPKILIAEDHPLAQQALATLLKSLGYTNIFTAATHADVIEVVEQEHEFDILICTITAPNAPELDLLRSITKHGQIHAVVLINETSSDLHAAIHQFTKLCGHTILDELRKPLSKTALQTALSNFPPKQPAAGPVTVPATLPAKAIATAAERKQFIPYFQPKVNIQTMEVVGVEILMRWNHPNLGVLGPDKFIDVAKRFGHLDAMTLSVLEQALSVLSTQKLDKDFKLAVNIDAAQLSKPDFQQKLSSLINRHGANAANIILEITETGVFKSPLECLSNLIKLRLLGFGISIDDFGTGLSSLQRVCDLPCTEIKLDMSFVRSLKHNNRNRLAVASMVKLSQEMGVQLVAEGIETEEQLILLRNMNCTIGQGYLFSAPLSANNLVKWLKQHEESLLIKAN